MLSRGIACTIFVALAGCGGGTTRTPPPDTAESGAKETEAAPEVSPPPKAWEQMSFEARQGYMMEKVLPVMEAKFQAFDAEHFEDFSCLTCHGEDARDREFEMPNPALPPLYPTGHPEQKRVVEEEKEMATFMFQQVVPSMQTLLGAAPYDEETGEGFSCFSCHPKGEEAAGGADGAEPLAGEGSEAEGAEGEQAAEEAEGAEGEGEQAEGEETEAQ